MNAPLLHESTQLASLLDKIWVAIPAEKIPTASLEYNKSSSTEKINLDKLLNNALGSSGPAVDHPCLLVALQFIRDHMDSKLLWEKDDRDKYLENFTRDLGISMTVFWALYREWNQLDTL